MNNRKPRRRTNRLRTRPDLETTLQALRQGEHDRLTSVAFYGLSGLTDRDMERVSVEWNALGSDYRRKFMRHLVDIAETNVEFDYRAFGYNALRDADEEVREAAIDLLFDDMSIGLMDTLIDMAQWDEAARVRAAAASALGRFILAGELGELPESETVRAQDTAVSLLTSDDEDVDVRRRALEAIANCSHEIVEEAINEAYHSTDLRMRASALFAMGRSCDEQWADAVLHELDSNEAELRYEAARAAGELELRAAVPALVRLAVDSDREIQEVAIWSLGEIGGQDATRALSMLLRRSSEAGDADLEEAIEDALANASLVDDELFEPDHLDD